MTLMIDIQPDLEERLRKEAMRRGVSSEELARTFLEERILSSTLSPLWERLAE